MTSVDEHTSKAGDLDGPSAPKPSAHSLALVELYKQDYLAHRDCGPDCLAGQIARQHLLANDIDPAEVS